MSQLISEALLVSLSQHIYYAPVGIIPNQDPSPLYFRLVQKRCRKIIKLRLIFIQAGNLLIGHLIVVAEYGNLRSVYGIRHQEGKPLHIIRKSSVMLPPDIVRTHIGRALLFTRAFHAVIESMGHKQVYSPQTKPVNIPFHISGSHVPRYPVTAAYAETLVCVSAPAQMPCNVRRQLRLDGVKFPQASRLGRYPPHNQILSRNMEVQLLLYIIAFRRMPHQGYAVPLTPSRKPCIENLPQLLLD